MSTTHTTSISRSAATTVLKETLVLDAAYIEGRWTAVADAAADRNHSLVDPSLDEVIATTQLCSKADVDSAAHAAKRALPSWSSTPVTERARYLTAIAEAMENQFDELVGLSVLNNGKPIEEAKIDVSDAIVCYRYYAKLIADQPSSEVVSTQDPNVRLLKMFAPVGVCALIVPWNFPMVTTAWKLAPALAAGCTVLLKPSEVTLLPELMLGNILTAIDLPKGVVNIVPGAAEVGAAMTAHSIVDKISFTGSNAVGEKVMAQAAIGTKDISLELGGKSAIIIRADADIEAACDLIIGGIFANAGQICSATSRLLVHKDIADDLYQLLRVKTQELNIGDGFDPLTQLGPLVSSRQLAQVQKYLEIAKSEALVCVTGGAALDRPGYFVKPTIYKDVPSSSRLWQEEIFGPVLVSQSFTDDQEAIDLANDSSFALAATIVSADESAALQLASQIQAGHIWINEFQIVLPESGWGGFKQSGIGRELGADGLAAYQKSKHILLPAKR